MNNPFDLSKLELPESYYKLHRTPGQKARISKRRLQFIAVPYWWYERLVKADASKAALVAMYLLRRCWQNHGGPVKLSNTVLRGDGVSRKAKYGALARLKSLGLITVTRRASRAPLVTVHLEPPATIRIHPLSATARAAFAARRQT
jgi:hypothetical protein